MKPIHHNLLRLTSVIAIFSTSLTSAAVPEIAAALRQQYGQAHLQNVVLFRASPSTIAPIQWNVYSKDPYRPGELIRTTATLNGAQWVTSPSGAGSDLLQRTPPKTLDLTRVKIDSAAALDVAKKAAALAQATVAQAAYQLATNDSNLVPEWGIELRDATGFEIGFCVVSAETGALVHQSWTPKTAASTSKTKSEPETEGEMAAKKVKKGVRKAWNWTEDAGKTTGSFFRELFKGE
jgi:hypothetical protein